MYPRRVLVASSEVTLGAAGVRSCLLFERAVRGMIVERRALAFDTRYAAAAAGKPEPVGHLFLMLAGELQLDTGERLAAPSAFVLADDEWERRGERSRTFRTTGERVDVLQLRIAREHVRVPIGVAAGAVPLPSPAWDAAGGLLAAGPSSDAASLARLIDALASAGVVTGTLTSTLIGEEPERFRRLWDALQPLYQTYGATTSLKQLADRLDMSMRQVGRDAKELSAAFGIGGGYRDALLMMRLRTAVLLLSAPDAGVAEVARLVGYGSPIAMARAFRDARLPPPSIIQADLRGDSSRRE
jgi:AraC-like DNA-binding protein